MPATSAPTSAATAAARIAAVSGSRPVRTTVAPHAASARTVASPMPRVPPVTIATRPARSAIHAHVPQHLQRDREARHIEDLIGVQLEAELVLDGRHERHVSERVPRRDPPVREGLDLDAVAQLQRVPEDPGEPVARSHLSSDLGCSARISLTTLSLRFAPREDRWRSRVYQADVNTFLGERNEGGRKRPRLAGVFGLWSTRPSL